MALNPRHPISYEAVKLKVVMPKVIHKYRNCVFVYTNELELSSGVKITICRGINCYKLTLQMSTHLILEVTVSTTTSANHRKLSNKKREV